MSAFWCTKNAKKHQKTPKIVKKTQKTPKNAKKRQKNAKKTPKNAKTPRQKSKGCQNTNYGKSRDQIECFLYPKQFL